MALELEELLVPLPQGRVLTLGQLLASWQAHVSRIAEEMYKEVDDLTWGAHDYFAALSIRDFLDRGAEHLSPTQRSELELILEPTDALLDRITESDEKGMVTRFGEVTPSQSQWWWRRVPLTGLIRTELESWLVRVESPPEDT